MFAHVVVKVVLALLLRVWTGWWAEKKVTNHDACRDLSGRRLREVRAEKMLTEWLETAEAREAEERTAKLKRKQEEAEAAART